MDARSSVASLRRYEAGCAAAVHAVDFTETDKAFEIKIELRRMSERDIEVKATSDVLQERSEEMIPEPSRSSGIGTGP